MPESDARSQTPSTGLRHPSFGGRCRKAVLGVWLGMWGRSSGRGGGAGGGGGGNRGQIQGDGPKFLDRFKSYFGSQISSQSLNEIHICRLQLKSATKGEFFLGGDIFVFDCQFESAHVAL